MIFKILLALLVIAGGFLAYVALLPSDYVISREQAMSARPEKIFPYLNNSKLAMEWSPWQEVDPQAKMEVFGPDEGVGSGTRWDAGKQLGKGSATITGSTPNQSVQIRLEYQRPFEMTQEAEYSIRPSGDQSIVTWSVKGKNSFMGRLMCVFMNMDKMVGAQFEKGLYNLKKIVESK